MRWCTRTERCRGAAARWLLGLLLLAASGAAPAFFFEYRTLTELAPTAELRALHEARARILAAAENADTSRFDPAVDAQVEAWFEDGLAAWRASALSRRIQNPQSFYENPYQLYFVTVLYFESSGRSARAIPYLRAGRDAAEGHLIIGAMLEFQERLVRNLDAIGQHEIARLEITRFHELLQSYFPASREQDPASLDLLSLYLYLKSRDVELAHALEHAGNLDLDLDLDRWRAEFAWLLEADGAREALRYMFPGPQIEDPDRFDLLVHSRPGEPDYFTNRHLMPFYEHYARLFARAGEPQLARRALETARTHHRANVDRLTIVDRIAEQNYARRFHNTGSLLPLSSRWLKDEKLRQRRVPFRSRTEQHLIAAEIELELGEGRKALSAVAAARREFAAVDELFDALRPTERRFAGIDRQALAIDLLEARALEALGRHEEAIAGYERHVAAAERLRASIPLDERARFFRSSARHGYFGLLRSQVALYRAAPSLTAFRAVVEASEALRSRTLRELLGTESTGAALDFEAVRASLARDDGVLLFVDLEETLLVLYFDAAGLELREVAKGADFDEEIFWLRNELSDALAFEFDAFSALAATLLGPVDGRLASRRRLYVLTDGAVSAIPLEILPLADGRLVADVASVTYLPSLDFLATAPRSAPRGRMLAVADPVYDEARAVERVVGRDVLLATRGAAELELFTPLPETRDEAAAIVAMTGDEAVTLFGADAAESRLKAMDLTDFRFVHIATHGVIGGELPTLTEPAIVLSWEQEEDGLLTVSEVARLAMDAEIAILSACNTGNGDYFRGEGLMGMGRAFIEAGAQNVVVSLWPVDSFATKELMVRFYEHLTAGERPADALAAAKRSFLTTGPGRLRGLEVGAGAPARPVEAYEAEANPFYWSPFILISASR